MLKRSVALAGMMMSGMFAAPADARHDIRYEVAITNITRGQTFTPQLVATHDNSIALFTLGTPATDALGILAEAGDTAPVTAQLESNPYAVSEVTTIPGLLGPGQSVSTEISASFRHRFLTVAAMLIPTNDTFVALNAVPLPRHSTTYTARAYDAGTEANDQNCRNIPGPRCGGEAASAPADSDEGFVYVSNGFHTLPAAESGEVLAPAVYDWRNPVARIVVRRVR